MTAWIIATLVGAVAFEALWIWRLSVYVNALQQWGRETSGRADRAEAAAAGWQDIAKEIEGRREITVPIQPRTGGPIRPMLRPPRTEADQ